MARMPPIVAPTITPVRAPPVRPLEPELELEESGEAEESEVRVVTGRAEVMVEVPITMTGEERGELVGFAGLREERTKEGGGAYQC